MSLTVLSCASVIQTFSIHKFDLEISEREGQSPQFRKLEAEKGIVHQDVF